MECECRGLSSGFILRIGLRADDRDRRREDCEAISTARCELIAASHFASRADHGEPITASQHSSGYGPNSLPYRVHLSLTRPPGRAVTARLGNSIRARPGSTAVHESICGEQLTTRPAAAGATNTAAATPSSEQLARCIPVGAHAPTGHR